MTAPSAPEPSAAPPVQAPTARKWRWLRELVPLAALVLVMLGARSSLADHYYVPTGSMIPTVAVGDRLIVNKLAYGLRLPFSDLTLVPFSGPARGEVVILTSPEDGQVLLKRVAALPGDLVAVRDGRLVINGQAVPVRSVGGEPVEELGAALHPLRLTRGGGADYGPVKVPPDRYLVLGDNRGESHDGRSFGLVERAAIMGRAVGVYMRDGGFSWHGL